MNDATSPTPDVGNDRAVELFRYQDREVRTVVIDGEPWFVGADVCSILGYSRVANALRMLDADDLDTQLVSGPDGLQRVSIINEPGLYSLILRSRKPEAKAFKRWVTHEVLPAIRRTGAYTVAQPRTVIDQMIVTRDLANRAGAADAIEGRLDGGQS